MKHAWDYDEDNALTDSLPPVPPTEGDVESARSAVHEELAAEQVQARALPRAVRKIAEENGARAGAAVARRIGVVGGVLAILASAAVSVAAYQQAESTDRTVTAALAQLDVANSTLESRGQAPVVAPANADLSEAVTAAVLARVLTQLPAAPTADQVASAILPAVTANVLGPSMDQLTELAAAYLRLNPPKQGPPPTQAEIDAAVGRQYAANPPAAGEQGIQGAPGIQGEPGPPGDLGPPGPGRSIVSGPKPVRAADGTCWWRTEYSSGDLVEEYPAGAAACPAAAEQPGDTPVGPGGGNGVGIVAPSSFSFPFLFTTERRWS